MDLVDKQVGAEGNVKVVISGGKIMLVGSEVTKGLGIDVSVSVSVDYFLDELAAKIPGSLDDAIIAVVKSALKAL